MTNLPETIAVTIIVFVASFGLLMAVEKLIHRLTKNPDRSYRVGVWSFATLAAAYAFATSIGR